MLTLWITLYLIAFYEWLIHSSNVALRIFAAALIAAILTKSIAGCLFLPALFIFTLATGNGKKLIGKNMLFAIASVAGLISFYLIAREFYQPGYFDLFWKYDIIDRFGKVQEGHSGPFTFYYDRAINWQWNPYIYMLIPAAICLLYKADKRYLRFTLFILLNLLLFLLTISFSATKIDWYATPYFPIGSLILGMAANRVLLLLWPFGKMEAGQAGYLKKRIATGFSFAVILVALYAVVSKNYKRILQTADIIDDGDPRTRIAMYMNGFAEAHPGKNRLVVLYEDYNAPLQFYAEVLAEKRELLLFAPKIDIHGISKPVCLIGSTTGPGAYHSLQPGDIVILSEDKPADSVQAKWNTEITDHGDYNVRALLIKSKK